mmetsp:Transcript_46820/g.100119  ORF Transcript_46820/g.100119 Transcript_46820/m.100119 type:complete len:530 (-) Transcript_46820:60-1649(-)
MCTHASTRYPLAPSAAHGVRAVRRSCLCAASAQFPPRLLSLALVLLWPRPGGCTVIAELGGQPPQGGTPTAGTPRCLLQWQRSNAAIGTKKQLELVDEQHTTPPPARAPRSAIFAHFAAWVTYHFGVLFYVTCGVLAVVLPLTHWFLSDRKSERALFNHLRRREDSSEGPVENLAHIRLDPMGGLGKVAELMPPERPSTRRLLLFIGKVIATGFNIFMMILLDTRVMLGAMEYYHGDPTEHLPPMMRKYLDLTHNLSLISVRHAVFVAVAELLGIAVLVIVIAYRTAVFWFCRRSQTSQFDAFLSLHEVFDGLYLLSSFSAMQLLSVAHPALLWSKFQLHMARPFFGSAVWAKTAQAAYFVATRCMAGLLGILAFGVKLAFVSVYLYLPIGDRDHWFANFFWRWSVVLTLLLQTMGCVLLERVLRWRVMLLIVGAKVDTEGSLIHRVYMARVTQAVHAEYLEKGRIVSFLSLMMTFDDRDVQRLLIDENEELKLKWFEETLKDARSSPPASWCGSPSMASKGATEEPAS